MHKENNIPKKSKIDYASDFKISHMKPKIKATDPHKHDEYHELIYLTDGAGFHTIDLQTYQIDVPSLFLVKAGEVHYWEFTEVPEGYVVIFKSDFLAHLSTDGIYSSFNQTRNRYFPLDKYSGFPFTSLFQLIEAEYSSGDHFSNRVIASSLELIFTQMFRILQQNKQTDLSPKKKTFRKFQELMDTHIHECYLVKEYAEMLHVTPKHLNEITKQETGQTASELITKKRILEAQRQLLYSSQNISEISHTLDFSSPSHFVTFFKNNVGTTPEQHRREKVTDM